MNDEAVKDLLFKMADDQLILGHRNSEWTGIGPILEEDIAFSSMAQDKIGHSLAFYSILHSLGAPDPDTVAFTRNAGQFHNCKLVELPIGGYDFSLIRHFLFDNAELIRFEMLGHSAFEPVAEVAKKLQGEVKYHVMHADAWIKKLGAGTEESIGRLQKSLDYAMPYALGIFEASAQEDDLIGENVFEGEEVLRERWKMKIMDIIAKTKLVMPDVAVIEPETGGRYGKHTGHLQPLLDEMSEVINIDPAAEW